MEPSHVCSSIINSVWRVEDLVDAKDTTMGDWFEGDIQKIDVNENKEMFAQEQVGIFHSTKLKMGLH